MGLQFASNASPVITQEATVPRSQLHERLSEVAEVSGRLGIAGSGDAASADSLQDHLDGWPAILASGLAKGDAFVCFELSAMSGLYRGRFSVRVVHGAGRLLARFDPSPAARRVLRELTTGEVAVLATASGSASCSDTKALLPAAWVGKAASAGTRWYVNSLGATSVELHAPPGPAAICQGMSAALTGRRTAQVAYDVFCDLPPDPRAACGVTVPMSLLRLDGRTYRAPEPVKFRRPC